MDKYYWQGELVKVEFGYSLIKPNKEKPLYWYNYECSLGTEKIPAIRVIIDKDTSFVLANHFGIGVHKLMSGGWPGKQHFSLTDHLFHRSDDPLYLIHDYNESKFIEYELGRDEYFKESCPDEYKKIQDLRKLINGK